MAGSNVLDIYRTDPFAPRLDHVLGAISDFHIAVFVDVAHIAGRKETLVVQHVATLCVEVTAGNPRAFHPYIAGGLSIAGGTRTIFQHNFHLHPIGQPALL